MNKKQKNISEEELNRAVRKFIDSGGIIKKLPDQKSAQLNRVGGRWCSTEVSGDSSL